MDNTLLDLRDQLAYRKLCGEGLTELEQEVLDLLTSRLEKTLPEPKPLPPVVLEVMDGVLEVTGKLYGLGSRLQGCTCCKEFKPAANFCDLYGTCEDCCWCQFLGQCGEGEFPTCCHGKGHCHDDAL